jgi:hypothetical protein
MLPRGARALSTAAAAPPSLAVFTWGAGVSGALGHGSEYNERCARVAAARAVRAALTRGSPRVQRAAARGGRGAGRGAGGR